MMLVFLIALLSSAVGAICGIGGGVVIKPVMDMFRIDSVAAISFLSGCTVLSMSCYTVGRAMLAGEGRVDVKTGTPLALGAALGGLAGKALFTAVKDLFQQSDMVGAVQSACRYHVGHAGIYAMQSAHPYPPPHRACCLLRRRAGFGDLLQFPGDRRRADQSGRAVLFVQHGHQDGGSQQSVYHPVQPAGQPSRHADRRNHSGSAADDAGVDDRRRNRRRHHRTSLQQEDG